MKFEYEKPNLEELELVLEGSFLNSATGSSTEGASTENPGIGVDPNPGEDFE